MQNNEYINAPVTQIDKLLWLSAAATRNFCDLQRKVDLWVVKGDMVTAVVTVSGKHQAAILDVAPTGKTVKWSSIDIWRVKDGKITDVWHNFPSGDILLQIGYTLEPPAK